MEKERHNTTKHSCTRRRIATQVQPEEEKSGEDSVPSDTLKCVIEPEGPVQWT
jgi:hypothetical protein